ncbi:hypothetical protein KJ652_06075 [Patescibacteria group bacterium]|nr:hypothetical protein [Patescibacteria group bacterium]
MKEEEHSTKAGIVSELLDGIIGWILIIAIIWVEFGGIYHSFSKHGITNGIIATAVPPVSWYRSIEFFFHKDKLPLPIEYTEDRDNFLESLKLLREAAELSQPPNKSDIAFGIPIDQEQQIFSMIEEGIELSNNVGDDFLVFAHPELKRYYKDILIRGNELYFEGAQNSYKDTGVLKQITGNKLVIEWIDWWNANNRKIGNRIFD